MKAFLVVVLCGILAASFVVIVLIAEGSRYQHRDRDELVDLLTWLLAAFLIIGNVTAAAFVAEDAANRGHDSPALWLLSVLLFNIVAIIAYLASRRPGRLVTCRICHNQRLNYAAVCPHCRMRSPGFIPPVPPARRS